MNQPWQPHKRKNWQWRTIIFASVVLLYGQDVGHWFANLFSFDQFYSLTANAANRANIITQIESNPDIKSPLQLIIDVKNDTPSQYNIDTKIVSGQVNFPRNAFLVGEVKRFTITPNSGDEKGTGDIVFISQPMAGSYNTQCKEIHILNYDLKYANLVKQPLVIKLSAIASRLECKDLIK